jgi:hypothetical protein
MTLAYRADHVSRAVARLIERYRQPRTSALLASWVAELQAVEDAYWQLYTERHLATASGATLDLLGDIVGQPRDGRDDATYRLWISARVLVQRSSGTTEQIIAIADKLAGGNTVVLREYYPASFVLDMGALDSHTGLQIAQLIVPAKAAGVRFMATWSNVAWPAVFTFAPADVPIAASPKGFDAGRWAFVSDGDSVVAIESFTFNGSGPDFGFDRSLLGG